MCHLLMKLSISLRHKTEWAFRLLRIGGLYLEPVSGPDGWDSPSSPNCMIEDLHIVSPVLRRRLTTKSPRYLNNGPYFLGFLPFDLGVARQPSASFCRFRLHRLETLSRNSCIYHSLATLKAIYVILPLTLSHSIDFTVITFKA